MKQKLAILALLIVAALACAEIARAETVKLKGRCIHLEYDTPEFWKCNKGKWGAGNDERFETWYALKDEAIKRGIKIPKRVILDDPFNLEKGVTWYRTYWKGNTFHFIVNPGCFSNNINFGLKILKRKNEDFDPIRDYETFDEYLARIKKEMQGKR